MGTAPVLAAQPDWRRMDFLSDLHLQPSDKATFDAWAHYMASPHCDAMFILGDLFEVWVGDDILSDPTHGMFWQQCADVIRRTSEQIPVFFMHGNRDFLVGQRLLSRAGLTALADPTVLAVDTERWVLSHGDALCLTDKPYQAFRAEVRDTAWQTAFLARPLPDRLALVRHMREASEHRKLSSQSWIDVDNAAACALLQRTDATVLIHGHTHMPATHKLCDSGLVRHVLSDWDATSQPPRLQVLSATRQPHAPPGDSELGMQVAPPIFSNKNIISA